MVLFGFSGHLEVGRGRTVDAIEELLRQDPVEPGGNRSSRLDHIRGRKGRDDGNRNDDRIDEVAQNAHIDPQGRDDKGELTELGQGKSRMDRRVQTGSGHQCAHRRKDQDTGHGDDGDDQNRTPLRPDDDRVHHHADGNEENRPEEVLDMGQQMLNPFPFQRFRQDGTHHESAERGGKADGICDDDHREAKADGKNQQGLVIEQLAGLLEDGRNDIDAHQEPQDQEEDQFSEGQGHFGAFELSADRQGGEQHHQEHRNEVLHHQGAENQRRIGLVLEAHVVIGLDDDGRGRHAHQTAKENALHQGPAHQLSQQDADHKHAETFDPGHQHGPAADFQEFLEAEFQSQGEKKEDDADFRPFMDGFGAGQMEQAELRPHDKTGDDIAENQRLLERFGNKGEKTGRNQDNGQVFDEIQFFCHANQ